MKTIKPLEIIKYNLRVIKTIDDRIQANNPISFSYAKDLVEELKILLHSKFK